MTWTTTSTVVRFFDPSVAYCLNNPSIETNSVNDGGSEQEQWSVNGEDENRIGVDDLPSQPFSIPRKSPLANGTHTPSPVPPIPATANGNGHFTVPPKEEWREQFIREQDPIANIGKNCKYREG